MSETLGFAAILLALAIWSYLDDLGEARKIEAQARLEEARAKNATPEPSP